MRIGIAYTALNPYRINPLSHSLNSCDVYFDSTLFLNPFEITTSFKLGRGRFPNLRTKFQITIVRMELAAGKNTFRGTYTYKRKTYSGALQNSIRQKELQGRKRETRSDS